MTNLSHDPPSEARAIYAAIFGGAVPDRVASRYAEALAALPLAPNPVSDHELLGDPARLAAIEYYLRISKGARNGLSQRFHVVTYLAEIEPEVYPRFARERAAWFGAMLDLGRAGLSAPLAFVRGAWLWRRRAHV